MPVRLGVKWLCCAFTLAFTNVAWGADTPPAKKQTTPAVKTAPAKSASKQTHKVAVKASPKALTKATLKKEPAGKATSTPALRGPTETLTCRNGTEDRHARIGVVLIGGKVESFAYYSKWKPRTCSI